MNYNIKNKINYYSLNNRSPFKISFIILIIYNQEFKTFFLNISNNYKEKRILNKTKKIIIKKSTKTQLNNLERRKK